MPAVCRGLCNLLEMPKPKKTGGFYRNGFKRCSYCVWWMSIQELKRLGYNPNRCPCCNLLLKKRPNSKEFRKKYDKTMQVLSR